MRKLSILLLTLPAAALAQIPTISVSPNVLQEGQSATATCTANCTGLTWKVNTITGGNSTVGTIAGSGSTATYTAPASIVANNVWGGCPSSFDDSIWNVPVSALSMISNWNGDPFLNDAWYHTYENSFMSALSMDDTFLPSITHNSTPTINIQGLSGINIAFDNIPMPQYPYHFRESGLYDYNNNHFDHHTISVNVDTCNIWEVYEEHLTTQACANPSGGTCFKASSAGNQAPLTSQNAYNHGGTGAGGNMEYPYTLHLSEVLAAVNDGIPIKHSLYLRPPLQADSGNGTNLMWPATYSTGFCAYKNVVGLTLTAGGSGYSGATTVTLSGGLHSGATAPVWTATIAGGVITGFTLSSHGTTDPNTGVLYSSTPTVVIADTGGGTGATATATIDYPCFPYGSRIALDATYLSTHTGVGCSAGSNCLTGAGLAVATDLANYGGTVLDNCCGGTGFTLDGSQDLEQDPAILSSIQNALSHLTFSNMHVYDTTPLGESSLTGSNVTGTGNAGVVTDNNTGYIPTGVAWITATNSSGQSFSKKIALQPPTIGTPDPEIPILAGDYSGSKGTSGGYQIPIWVEGTSSPSVTWSCSTCSGHGSSINASTGVYTPPTSESATGVQDVVVATLNSDSNITAKVYFDILPNAGNYAANTIRIDTGSSSNFGPDGNGHYWVGNVGLFTSKQNQINENWAYYKAPSGGGSEKTVYNSEVVSFDNSDLIYKIIVPNGQYRVRVMSGWDPEAANLSNPNGNHFPLIIAGEDNGYGGIKILHWNMMSHAANPFATQSNSDATFGELVSNNVLWASVLDDFVDNYPSDAGWTNCNYNAGTCWQTAIMSGLDVEPDTSATPHWLIGVTNAVNISSPSVFTSISDAPAVSTGGKLLVYVQDWYTGLYDPVFSLLRGPGSIAATNVTLKPGQAMPVAIYTAPTTSPANGDTAVIQACSSSNPAICAQLVVQIKGANGSTIRFK